MKITIFGSGYVGLVTAACFADVGNNVCCVDVDKDKIEKLNFGVVPIFEPGLEKLIKTNKDSNRLQFTDDLKKAVEFSDLIFIAVGTEGLLRRYVSHPISLGIPHNLLWTLFVFESTFSGPSS